MELAGVDDYSVCRACKTKLHSDDDYFLPGEQASIVLTESGEQAFMISCTSSGEQAFIRNPLVAMETRKHGGDMEKQSMVVTWMLFVFIILHNDCSCS